MEQSNIELSIIMVSYNEAAFLKQGIESVINQSYKNWELIIGDDGSSDNSLEIIKEYSARYPDKIRYYVMDRNDGVTLPSIRVSNNFKRGFSLARGKYLLIFAADDYYCNNLKFERDVNFLNKNKKYAACVSKFKYAFLDSSKDFVVGNNPNRTLFWSSCYTHIACFTFRKECLKNLLNNFCDDTGLIYSIACTGKWKCFNTVDFAYRQRENSIMSAANKIQLNLLELLLYDDLKTHKKFKLSSLSRFSKPMQYILKHRNEINENKDRFKNYLSLPNASESVASNLLNYDNLSFIKKLKIKFSLFNSKLLFLYFRFLTAIQTAFRNILGGKNEN